MLHSNPAKKGYARTAHTVWDQRCPTCQGKGEIIDIHGKYVPCPRCTEEEPEQDKEASDQTSL